MATQKELERANARARTAREEAQGGTAMRLAGGFGAGLLSTRRFGAVEVPGLGELRITEAVSLGYVGLTAFGVLKRPGAKAMKTWYPLVEGAAIGGAYSVGRRAGDMIPQIGAEAA